MNEHYFGDLPDFYYSTVEEWGSNKTLPWLIQSGMRPDSIFQALDEVFFPEIVRKALTATPKAV